MQIEGVLLDIDGTLMTGNDPIPGADTAIRFLQEKNIPYRYISNGTRKSRKNVLKKLERIGVKVSVHEIYTPAIAAIQYLTDHSIKACNFLITTDVMEDFQEAGIIHDPKAATVVVGDAGDEFTYASMNAAFRSLMQGGSLIALEKDRYWKDVDGLSLSAGPFVTALEYSSGSTPILLGKPSREFFLNAIKDWNIIKKKILMIGDDIMTDVRGAQDAGLLGAITFTGKFRSEDIDTCPVNPDFVINSIEILPVLLERSENVRTSHQKSE
ncbi:TIGR01458 family HAD-type hydrolase [Methanospirillum sp.]|uniref:TIGR01458 family HAD-type hydrolase n=1 Tax=Methanospirillum sp. TaxID=45200 RepID=UPI002CE159BA|nr:TIGR01458 family HAD-type hydrolase [Methanospirillum sp.]HPP78282.1 TIGR01458 family HAD-type hydrolase [Methanospirillum sp.]